MKKLLTLTAVLAFVAVSANAETLTNPFYMQEQGKIMSATSLDFENNSDFGKMYTLTEDISYGINDRIQVGANIAYGYFDPKPSGVDSIDDFTNPSIYGYYRLLNESFNLDLGASVELGLFDNDMTEKDYAYSAIVRASKVINQFSFGASATYTYVDPDNSAADSTSNVGIYAYGLYNINEQWAAGIDAGYAFNAIGEDYDSNPFTVRAIGTFEPKENMGFFAYVGMADLDEEGIDDSLVAGLTFKVLF
ncbi:hypothetical protein Dip510_000036 [Elusimicrobium posterum]|uniref:hypothetical protein n=1 Tax=Elusimicrobium posterum TaxID=3116653 RepID=UPI003C79501D